MLPCTHPSGRPRPPAQVRRTPSMNSFLDEEEQFAGHQLAASTSSSGRRAARLSTDTPPSAGPDEQLPSPTELRPAVNDVLNGRTREELQEMLLAAHTIIQKHQQGEFGFLTRMNRGMRRSPGMTLTSSERHPCRLDQCEQRNTLPERAEPYYEGSI